jgi:hypothetical protein
MTTLSSQKTYLLKLIPLSIISMTTLSYDFISHLSTNLCEIQADGVLVVFSCNKSNDGLVGDYFIIR